VSSFYLCHHPSSFFRRELAAARVFTSGRYALRNNQLTTYRVGAAPEVRVLTSSEELRAVLEGELALTLPDHPALREHLARLTSST
jgi:N-hydroxyarylamine O-acetyltransferase